MLCGACWCDMWASGRAGAGHHWLQPCHPAQVHSPRLSQPMASLMRDTVTYHHEELAQELACASAPIHMKQLTVGDSELLPTPYWIS